jgi:hypothetical protein
MPTAGNHPHNGYSWYRTFPGTPEQVREGGRGLTLVQVLTTDWGVKGDANGRTVWTEFAP